MSKSTDTKKQTKKGLGRGLGSLLGAPVEKAAPQPAKTDSTPQKQADQEVVEKVKFKESESASLKEGIIEKQEAKPQQVNIPETQRIWQIPLEKIKPQKDQPRKDFDPEGIKELAASVKEKGILQPIVVRRNEKKEFEIIAGERRWRAAQQAGLERIPVILKLTNEQDARELALIENIQRMDLNPIEEAEAYESLINKYKLTQQDLADRLGKERVSIANTLRLLRLHPDLRKHLKTGELSQGQAKALLSISDTSLQKKVGLETVKKGLTVRATEKLVAKAKANQDLDLEEIALESDIDVSARLAKGLAEELQKILKTKVAIDYKSGKGKIKIQFHSDLELNQIVDRLKN